MTDFKKHYIKLLRDQVEVEIRFLESVGHKQDLISEPCIFCFQAERPAGDSRTNGDFIGLYRCNRLKELQQFLSGLLARNKTSYGLKQYEYTTNDVIRLASDMIERDSSNQLLPPSKVTF